MNKLDLSLIIPAYNEEKKIEKDIKKAREYFQKSGIKAEIIVSTDGVRDKTNEIVKRLAEGIPYLKLISSKEKIGKGAALKKGVELAVGEIIMFADAGYCVPFEYIKNGQNILLKGIDCALASRININSRILNPQPFYRKVGSRVFGIIVRNILRIPGNIKDTQCGFKLYKRRAAKIIFSKLKTKGFMFDIELILTAKKLGFKQMQFPVEWANDSDTKLKVFSGSVRILKELFFIKFVYKL